MTTALVEDGEYELVVEALYAFREKKVAALQEAWQHAATRSFTARDFGIPQIDALLTRLDAKVPMDIEAATILANCNIRIPLKGVPVSARGNTAALVQQLRDKGLVVVVWSVADVPEGVADDPQAWLAEHATDIANASVAAGNEVIGYRTMMASRESTGPQP